MSPRRKFLAAAVLLAAALLPCAAGQRAWAQAAPQERLGRAESPIFDDNLDVARGRAIRAAQVDAIRGALSDLVADDWLALFDAEIRRSILQRVDRYISAYRVRRLDTSLDRTRYFAEVAAQIDRDRLEQDLRDLGLPVLGDPPRPIEVYYARTDPLLRRAEVRNLVVQALRDRLAKLNFSVAGLAALNARQAALLSPAAQDLAARAALLSDNPTVAGLFLEFDVPAQPAGASQPPLAEMRARFYQADNGQLLGAFVYQSRTALDAAPDGQPTASSLQQGLVEPLVAQIQPGALKPFGRDTSDPNRLTLRVVGFSSVRDEEDFEVAFFPRNVSFQGYTVARLDTDSVTYEGLFRGSRRLIADRLSGQQVGPFTIGNVFWLDGVLELDVMRQTQPVAQELKAFPVADRLPLQQRVIEAFLAYKQAHPDKEQALDNPLFTEQEDNGWFDKANLLEFDATIYGFVDSRGDLDFYKGEYLHPGEEVGIVIRRLDRTSLSPEVRIYDQQRKRVRTEAVADQAVIRYRLPKDETQFYLEVGDRVGYVDGDTGGYLSFHYIFTVRRGPARDKLAAAAPEAR